MKSNERYTLTTEGLVCRNDGEFARSVDLDRVSLDLHRVTQERDLMIRKANEERDSAIRAAKNWEAECCAARSGEAAPLKDTVLYLLQELQWHYEPYDDYNHRASGYYCPECGNEQDKGHDGGCVLDQTIKLLAGI